ncbi:hypothetical protein TNIN_113971 [Trichonephila inaurata madagascariensis]|uniref:Uncharacterized protein n=1 Tax=Trichonephila inaurata madagascariensis TaxID=2747483 RepID=A0A8X6X963_9ARAC|nr:hypothetical protein TNIN_113971 [Trichonephila inaurata madagascariensis]
MSVAGRISQGIARRKRCSQKLKDKSTGYTVNQIETSIPNQNNFLFNELQYVDVIVDDTPLSATLDSGANSVIINTAMFPEKEFILKSF